MKMRDDTAELTLSLEWLQIVDLEVVKDLALSPASDPSSFVHALPILASDDAFKEALVAESHASIGGQ